MHRPARKHGRWAQLIAIIVTTNVHIALAYARACAPWIARLHLRKIPSMTRRLALSIFILTISTIANAQFISVKDTTFRLNNRPYYFIGTNYWYGSLLGL